MAEATESCEILTITTNSITAATTNAVVRKVVHEYARIFHSVLIVTEPPTAQWPDDLLSNPARIISQMTRQSRAVVGMAAVNFMWRKKTGSLSRSQPDEWL